MALRLDDYFAGEATEYLERIKTLLTADPLDLGELLGLVQGARGSIQMAGADGIAGLAGCLESAVRLLDSERLEWTDDLRDLTDRTTAELRALLRARDRWGPDEDRRVRAAIEMWDGFGEIAPASGAARPAVPIEILFYDDAGPHVVGPMAPAGDGGVIPINQLLYRGDRALEAALALRPDFEAIARGEVPPERSLGGLVEELFDLLDLGLSPDPPEA